MSYTYVHIILKHTKFLVHSIIDQTSLMLLNSLVITILSKVTCLYAIADIGKPLGSSQHIENDAPE